MKYLIIALLLPLCFKGQVQDNFSDGDFSRNPAWKGDSSAFIVNPGRQLQLYDTKASTASLFTPFQVSSLKNINWEFFIRLGFSASSGNYARLYLASDRAEPGDSLNAYYLQFGEALSNDRIELFLQQGKNITSVCRGKTSIASSFSIRVKVQRDSTGNWSLFCDSTGGNVFRSEAAGFDTTLSSSSFLGLSCVYTASNAKGFYFDDFYAGPELRDTTAPDIDSIFVVNARTLEVFFSEAMDTASAQEPRNYIAGNGIGAALSARQDKQDLRRVHVSFPQNFPSRAYTSLSVFNLRDLSANMAPLLRDSFFYFMPRFQDVVINEIMADPDPAAGLPTYEYAELYNRSGFPVNLKGWSFTAGTNKKALPEYTLLPDSFLVLCSPAAAASFGNRGPCLALSSFPALINTGQQLVLRDPAGQINSSVNYSDKWYKRDDKKEGGWSLEQINPQLPCLEGENWTASEAPEGGTPGRKNSVWENTSDNSFPAVKNARLVSPDSIQITFNKTIFPESLCDAKNYAIEPGHALPVKCIAIEPGLKSVLLALSAPLSPATTYTVFVKNNLHDCSGNALQAPSSARIAIASPVSAGDILINEVLFDPPDENTAEFVELYNASGKILSLAGLRISTEDTLSGALTEICEVSRENVLFFPDEYLLLSKDGKSLQAKYRCPFPQTFLDMDDFPVLNNNGDVIVVSSAAGNILDRLVYTPQMHFPLLSITKGVSLERVSVKEKTNAALNWHSAAETAGYATPGYKNSQHLQQQSGTGRELSLYPPAFSPDNDGKDDILAINYLFPKHGYIASLSIYDTEGRITRQLCQDERVANEGSFYWDGVDNQGKKASPGIYVVFMQIIDFDGNTMHFKKPCTIIVRL